MSWWQGVKGQGTNRELERESLPRIPAGCQGSKIWSLLPHASCRFRSYCSTSKKIGAIIEQERAISIAMGQVSIAMRQVAMAMREVAIEIGASGKEQ